MQFNIETTKGMLIILSSPSGGGKSSVAKALLASDHNLTYSVSITSRPPRGEEVHGKDYYFYSEEDFFKMIREDAFYEWAKVHDNYYGTLRSIVDEKLAQGKDVVLDLDVVGGLNIKKANPAAVLIYIVPPSFEILETRLRARKTDTEEQILKRLRNAKSELNFVSKYDYAVLNEDLNETIAMIKQIIESERHSTKHSQMTVMNYDHVD